MKVRADFKKLMTDISEVYLKSLEEIAKYWKDSEEKRIMENGRERILSAEPEEKRKDTVKELEHKAFAKIQALKDSWEKSEDEFFYPSGADFTADKELLSDVFNPSLEQLQLLAEKYFNKNMVMEQAILNYAKNKEKYSGILLLPHTQSKEERLNILELYDSKQLRGMYKDTAERGGVAVKPYDFQNWYKNIFDKFVDYIA